MLGLDKIIPKNRLKIYPDYPTKSSINLHFFLKISQISLKISKNLLFISVKSYLLINTDYIGTVKTIVGTKKTGIELKLHNRTHPESCYYLLN